MLKISVLNLKPAGPVEFGCRTNKGLDKISLKFHQFSIRKLPDANNVGRLRWRFKEFTAVLGFCVQN
jgi:hypothetical protein